MNKTLFAFVTFGNSEFSKICVDSVRQTTESKLDFFTILGKPQDLKSMDWLSQEPDINYKVHPVNRGFPASLNDIFDYAWKENDYEYVIIAGNDTAVYPHCIDSMIRLADETDYECINALQYDVRDLTSAYPETREYFRGDKKLFSAFDKKPWEVFKEYSPECNITDMLLSDIQNMCLYKKSVFEKIGYTDVNFFPAYFVDNDYAKRMAEFPIKNCTLGNARFFHFWSRVLHQGTGGSTNRYFENNEQYYREKWGGSVNSETADPKPLLYIGSRDNEKQIIDYWRDKR